MHWSRPARAPGALYCAPMGDEVNIDAAYTYDAFSPLVLFALEQVELDEGPRLTSHIMGGGDQEIRIGQRVEVVFDDIDEELTLHGFRIVEPCDSAGIKRLRQTLYPDIQSQQPAGMDFGGELVGRKAEPSRRHVKRRKIGAAEGAGRGSADRQLHRAIDPSVRRIAQQAATVEHRVPDKTFGIN